MSIRAAAHLLYPDDTNQRQGNAMFDLLMIAVGVGAFAVTILYVLACDRL